MPATSVSHDHDQDEEQARRAGMTPFIDIIFLLLVFFVLTTRFIPEELAIEHVLPTDQGPSESPAEVPLTPPEDVFIAIAPATAVGHGSVAELERALSDGSIGAGDVVSFHALKRERVLRYEHTDDGAAYLAEVHAFVHETLAQVEEAGLPRSEQPPVTIMCYSELPWRHALAAYDAVRAYEQAATEDEPVALADARELLLSPPPSREHLSDRTRAEELQRLLRH